MKIEKIKKLANNRYSLSIDGEKHVIYDDVLLAFNIYKPCEITKEDYQKMLKENSFYEAYEKVIKYLTFKMRSSKEVKAKLEALNLPKVTIDKIMAKLTEQGYINDLKYLKCFINDQIALTLNGPRKITKELLKKGLKEDEINNALNEIPLTVWQEKLEKILNKKLKSAKNISQMHFKHKLRYDFINMGYDDRHFSDVMNKVILDDSSSYEKDREKLICKLSKKYEGEKLEYMVKQKLYALGYRR